MSFSSNHIARFLGVVNELRFTVAPLPRRLPSLLLLILILQTSGASSLSLMRDAQDGTEEADDARLLETRNHSKRIPTAGRAPGEIKIVCYNIRYRGGDELRRLIEMLRTNPELKGAGIIGLQEVDRHRRRSGDENNARIIAEGLGMNYAWTAPPRARADQPEDETGVALFSFYPLTDVERIVLPHAGPGGRRRVALGASLTINNVKVRVYTVHAETRTSISRKLDQQRRVLESLTARPDLKRAIVLGDFNTIEPKTVSGTSRLFTDAGFVTPFPEDRPTWKTFVLKLKLDWIWLRGFRETIGSGIVNSVDFSDHWPLWVLVKL